MLLITEADQYMGYAIASHLGRIPHLRSSMRLLCKNKKVCLNFQNKGMDVCVVDYTHPHHISVALRGVDHIIIAVGYDADRVAMAKNLIQMANQSGIQSITLISHVGAVSSLQQHPTLQHYGDIEQMVVDSDCPWTILRAEWVHQYFHLWAPLVEKHGCVPLPITEDAELCPIDITDICKVIEHLVVEEKNEQGAGKLQWKAELDEQHHGQIYTLTGSQPTNPKALVQMLAQATGYKKMEYRGTRPMDLAYYLQDLKHDIWFDARLKQENARIYQDDLLGFNYRSKVLVAPTNTQIQTMIEYFDWVKTTSSSIIVPHAPMITSLPCRPLRKFFQENANLFKPRV
ncbi:hypothetical protein BCR42DRAFT_367797 [Absidia repens]|uniref:NAD(P)-binding domain-containing protein n=1 Tax=Absidia repens TaxID=90262 RepID=A0A1X2ITN9_9FUNG|nr:hypothetical protein BCR42DRAFT_367797 [Absidia repens]